MNNLLDGYKSNDQRKEILQRIGLNLKWFMNEKGVNSVELNGQLGISTGTISKIVSSNYDYNPSVLTLYVITNYLGITIDDLFQKHAEKAGLQDCSNSRVALKGR